MKKITIELNDKTYCNLKAYAKAVSFYYGHKETYKDTAECIIRTEVDGNDKVFQGSPKETKIFQREFERQMKLLTKK